MMKRAAVLRVCEQLFSNGHGPGAELFTGSKDEWMLRAAIEKWEAENCLVVYGCDSPQPPFVRCMLAYGNLALMQREFMGVE